MKEILNVIHNTIYQFFDVCGDDEEVPMSDKDKLLLEVNKAICNNLKTLEQQPCEDVVSRAEIIHTLNTMDRYVADELTLCDTDKKYPKNEVFIVDDVYELIAENLPSVQPQPKRGRWKYVVDKTGHWVWECNDCVWQQRFATNYCPDCGADMRGEDE